MLRSGSVVKTFRGLLVEYFIADLCWRDRLGIALNRYQRGNALLNVPKDLLAILGLGGVLIGVRLDFIPSWTLPVVAFLWLLGCYTLGWWDEKRGFWKNQQRHLTGEIDEVHKEMWADIKKIIEKQNG